MLGRVALSPRQLEDYAPIIGGDRIGSLRHLAASLRNVRVLSLSLSSPGSWLTDLLATSVPLAQNVGVNAEWRVVHTDQRIEAATIAMYEALSGVEAAWTPELRQAWEEFTSGTLPLIEPRYDVVIVHDPQLVGLIKGRDQHTNGRPVRWIWHCHIDLSSADPRVWEDLRPYAEGYDAIVFESSDFAPPGWQRRPETIIPPGIDPLGPRNAPMDANIASMLVGKWGIDAARPLIAQISPFDPGSDALGLIEVYDALLLRNAAVQLAIVPTSIRDDERTRSYFEAVAKRANERPGFALPALATEIGNTEISAFQHLSTVVVQKSLRKGFALWLSEAMWKGRPVVAGRTAGTIAQVVDGLTGYLVPDTAMCIDRIAQLLDDRELCDRLGTNARAHVAEHFLITRYLEDVLRLLAKVVGA